MCGMRLIRTMLVVSGLLMSLQAVAQGRGPSADRSRVRAGEERDAAQLRADQLRLDEWLRGLVGRFRGRASLGDAPLVVTSCSKRSPGASCDLDSGKEVMTLQPDAPQWFELDCSAIGDGSGVSCLFESTEGTQYPPPLALLLGIDPDRAGIRLLWIDGSGNAIEYQGPLSGDTAKLDSPCGSRDCEGQIRLQIRSPGGDRPVEMAMSASKRPGSGPGRGAGPMESRVELQRLPRAIPVASSPMPATASLRDPPEDDELDEVLVLGQKPPKPERNRDDIAVWLRRLAGRFNNQGTLARGESGDSKLPVMGATDCVRIGEGPGLHCVIMLEAPNVETHLKPGAFMLGVDLETPTIRYTSIDDTGASVGATGDLRGDTATFTTPCKSSLARACITTTCFTAQRGSGTVRLQVETVMDGRVISRYDVSQMRVTANAP